MDEIISYMICAVKMRNAKLRNYLNRQKDRHKSRSRQYIDRAKDWVEWTQEKPPRVKNSVLPRFAGYISILYSLQKLINNS